jgi:hypothetical protein
MKNIKEIKDFTDVVEFTDGYDIYKKDNRARTTINKMLETNYRAVYRKSIKYKDQWKFGDIDWSGEHFYVVTEKNRVIKFTNSEWAWFKEV